ncbi:MAG: Arc family DNA-binding protein [Chloroflexi bacterium]|nr:Arc family DNA-binding protein [Chloroflexota bacterium]
MPVNLSIKNVPDDIAERLRERAKKHRRSLQGELMVILEEALKPRGITVEELYRTVQESGLRTPSESVAIIREERDAR